MNRRDFIAALFAGIAGSRILPADTEITPVILCGRWQHYSYFFQAEYDLSLAVDRNFLLDRVMWSAPEGALVQIYDKTLLANGVLSPGISAWPLCQPLMVEAGSQLSVKLRNTTENFLRHWVSLMLTGQREITEQEAEQMNAEAINAEFEDEDESEDE